MSNQAIFNESGNTKKSEKSEKLGTLGTLQTFKNKINPNHCLGME